VAATTDLWSITNLLWRVGKTYAERRPSQRTKLTCPHRTEPNTGLETLKLQTKAVKKGDYYEVTGSKMSATIVTIHVQSLICSQLDNQRPNSQHNGPPRAHLRSLLTP